MVGTKVKILNPFLVTYPLEGIIVDEKRMKDGSMTKYRVQLPDFAGAIWLTGKEFMQVK